MPEIRIDGEEILKRIQQIEYILDGIRSMCASGSFTRADDLPGRGPETSSRHGTPITQAPQTGQIDVSRIMWMTKGRDPAGPKDPWAWAFLNDEDGDLRAETRTLYAALLHEDPVHVGPYVISLSGRDNKLLSRKIAK